MLSVLSYCISKTVSWIHWIKFSTSATTNAIDPIELCLKLPPKNCFTISFFSFCIKINIHKLTSRTYCCTFYDTKYTNSFCLWYSYTLHKSQLLYWRIIFYEIWTSKIFRGQNKWEMFKLSIQRGVVIVSLLGLTSVTITTCGNI